MKEIVIQSFNGIGDLLMVTPTLKVIKEKYGDEISITVNTNYPELLFRNPYVDYIGRERQGVFLGYPDPIHLKQPTQHHIYTDWEIVCNHYGITTERPELRPQLFLTPLKKIQHVGGVAIQNIFTNKYGRKKIWPYAAHLSILTGWPYIPKFKDLSELRSFIFGKDLIICVEGGIHHLAAALGTPAVVIYGGFIKPEWTGYSYQANIVNRLDCSDACYNHHSCKNKEKHKCWKDITVNNVIDVAIKRLRKNVLQIPS